MRFLFIVCLMFSINAFAQTPDTIYTLAPMPEPVANNAVVEGWVNSVPYVYSFGGIDSTLLFSGIHNKSWRYNTHSNVWEAIAPLPDPQGKIASAASRIGNIIYIMGGYYVASNGSETSSSRVHRYDINQNAYLSDGTDIPVAIDDHVQAVWRDSLIYVVTGWSNTGNVPNVQIYDPTNDNWQIGTAVPNNNMFTVFGATGTIIGDTIYYYGGASNGFNFPATSQFRMGIIDSQDPTNIQWQLATTQFGASAYRPAVFNVGDSLYFLGGSGTSYNYDAIAYNGSGIVNPNNAFITNIPSTGNTTLDTDSILNMDYRGAAVLGDYAFYLAGGIGENGEVSNALIKGEWAAPDTATAIHYTVNELALYAYPNPSDGMFTVKGENGIKVKCKVLSVLGEKIEQIELGVNRKVDLTHLVKGIYFIQLNEYPLQLIYIE